MVCLLTPISRPTSAALRPASSCFSAPIISTSLYFLFAMHTPPHNLLFSYTPLRGFWGAGQENDRKFADQLATARAAADQMDHNSNEYQDAMRGINAYAEEGVDN